jgi:hypothetical protein
VRLRSGVAPSVAGLADALLRSVQAAHPILSPEFDVTQDEFKKALNFYRSPPGCLGGYMFVYRSEEGRAVRVISLDELLSTIDEVQFANDQARLLIESIRNAKTSAEAFQIFEHIREHHEISYERR